MENKLRYFREKNNISQETLAKVLTVSRQTVISIEKQRYNPSLELAFSIAKYFNCRIEDIFIPNNERNDQS
ncbi:MAG: helix-turn-helix transcriptional regulator [Bacillus sp. (in: firmicutes)]